jgi:hypothetical protein
MQKKVELDPVHVHNDAEMVSLKLRQPLKARRDPSVWTKTEKERRLWKQHRRFPVPDSKWSAPTKVSRFVGRLTVHVRGLDKTTYSHKCVETDVPYLLSKYRTDKSMIIRAFWNGKEIDPERLLLQAV